MSGLAAGSDNISEYVGRFDSTTLEVLSIGRGDSGMKIVGAAVGNIASMSASHADTE